MPFQSEASGSQGATLYVEDVAEPHEGVAPSPITLSSITLGNPTVLTFASAPDLLDGDVVEIAGVTGVTALNGVKAPVATTAVATELELQFDSSGLTGTPAAGTVTPVAWHQLCEAKDFNLAGGQSTELDATTMCSQAKETRLGLADYGEATVNYNYVPCNPGILELDSAWQEGTARWFKLVFPPALGAVVKDFVGFVRSTSFSLGVDQLVAGSATIRISGVPITVGC